MKKIDNIEDLNNILDKNKIEVNLETNKKITGGFTITEEIEKYDKLKTKMLKYIMYKKRSENEIRQKFADEDENMVEDAIIYFKEQKYINDLEYIERFINEYIALKNLSIKELKFKLISKGITKIDIDNYFELNYEKLLDYEYKSASNIVRKKIKKEEIETIKNYLYKKGYMYETVNNAIDDIDFF